eukprot:m.124517 g.124517  ORF g.124517 m.124517 type:complete len:434 (+) comp15709_c0_seq5:1947-3248(+)
MTVATSVWSLCIATAVMTAILLESQVPERLQATLQERPDAVLNDFAESSSVFARVPQVKNKVKETVEKVVEKVAKKVKKAEPEVVVPEPEDESGHVGRIVQQHGNFASLFTERQFTVHSRGHRWLEGPIWLPADSFVGKKRVDEPLVVFSDVKTNQMRFYSPATQDTGVFHEPSGCFGDSGVDCDSLIEPGSNGLAYHPSSRGIIACQHGARQVAMIIDGENIPLATHYGSKRLNSPNDLSLSPGGDLYFTDPSYGLNKREEDPARELSFNGVYYLNRSSIGKAIRKKIPVQPTPVVIEGIKLSHPNGIVVDPSAAVLYITQCDPSNNYIVSCPLKEDSQQLQCGHFADVKAASKLANYGGCADGIKVDKLGRVWATGPNGVHVFSPQGQLLGYLQTGAKTGNLVFGKDQRLYVAASDKLLSIGLRMPLVPDY